MIPDLNKPAYGIPDPHRRPPHFSYSQFAMWGRCGRQYYFRYIRGFKSPPVRPPVILGSAVHSAVAAHYTEKISTGRDGPLDYLTDYFVDDFRARSEEADWSPECPELPAPGKEHFEGDGLDVVKTFHSDAAPTVQPVRVEERFEIVFENADFTFVGFPDLEAAADDNGDCRIIIDHKVVGKKPAPSVAGSHQLTAYASAIQAEQGVIPQVGISALVRPLKTTPARHFRYDAERTDTEIIEFWKRVSDVKSMIDRGIFPYPAPDHMGKPNNICESRWCGYVDQCHSGEFEPEEV